MTQDVTEHKNINFMNVHESFGNGSQSIRHQLRFHIFILETKREMWTLNMM